MDSIRCTVLKINKSTCITKKSFTLIQHGPCWYFWGHFATMYFGQRMTCASLEKYVFFIKRDVLERHSTVLLLKHILNSETIFDIRVNEWLNNL